jgi:hypothetical protein
MDPQLLHVGHPNFTKDLLFELKFLPTMTLPDFPEPYGLTNYKPKNNGVDIRGPTSLDPEVVGMKRAFSIVCT